MKNENLLIAFVGGAIAGAIFGMFFAPEKGSVLRKKVCDMAHDKGHEAKLKLKHYLEAHGINLDWDQIEDLVDELIEKDSLIAKDDY